VEKKLSTLLTLWVFYINVIISIDTKNFVNEFLLKKQTFVKKVLNVVVGVTNRQLSTGGRREPSLPVGSV
jgi:hypothetical protein